MLYNVDFEKAPNNFFKKIKTQNNLIMRQKEVTLFFT